MRTRLGQALSNPGKFPLCPSWDCQPGAALGILSGWAGALAVQTELAASPEPSSIQRHSGDPPFHLGEVEPETVFSEIVTHALFPSSPSEWQSFNVRHSIRWDFCSQGSREWLGIIFCSPGGWGLKQPQGQKKEKVRSHPLKRTRVFLFAVPVNLVKGKPSRYLFYWS